MKTSNADDELIEAMCAAWFGAQDWAMWNNRNPEGPRCRADMAQVLAVARPMIREWVLAEMSAGVVELAKAGAA